MTGSQDRLATPFRLGEWTVEPALNRISREGEVVRLEPRAMDVLACLAGRPGLPLARHELLDAVWRTEFVADNTLTSTVAELRRAFGDDARRPRYIETISKRGYRLVAAVERLATGAGQAPEAAPLAVQLKLVGDASEYRLNPGENVIGRDPEAAVVIDAEKVSRRHARILVEGEQAVLEDLGSKNGTFVGGERLSGCRTLEHGDEIRLGRELATLWFVVADGRTLTER